MFRYTFYLLLKFEIEFATTPWSILHITATKKIHVSQLQNSIPFIFVVDMSVLRRAFFGFYN